MGYRPLPRPKRRTLIRTRYPGRCTKPNCGGFIAAGTQAYYGADGLEHMTADECARSKPYLAR